MSALSHRPYNLVSAPVEAHFSTISLEDLRKIQAKREAEEQKVDYSPEVAFMAEDKERLDKLISAVVVDTVAVRRNKGRLPKDAKSKDA